MEKSQSIKNIAAALIVFQTKIGKIAKTETNPFFNSKYADLSNILANIKTPLLESGLSFTQFPEGENGLITVLMHADSGEYMQTCYTMTPTKKDPQGVGSVITYMRRYALCAVLGLNVDKDDDGNAATHGSQKPQPAQQQQTQQTQKPTKPILKKDSPAYLQLIERIKEGRGTMQALEDKYTFGSDVRQSLQVFFDARVKKDEQTNSGAGAENSEELSVLETWRKTVAKCNTVQELHATWPGEGVKFEMAVRGIFKAREAEIMKAFDNQEMKPEEKQPAQSDADNKPWLNLDSKVYEKIVQRLKNKTTTMDQISQHFKLSKQVRAALQTIINSVAYSDN